MRIDAEALAAAAQNGQLSGVATIDATVDDLHRFWRPLVAGQIVGPELVTTLTTPRHRVSYRGPAPTPVWISIASAVGGPGRWATGRSR